MRQNPMAREPLALVTTSARYLPTGSVLDLGRATHRWEALWKARARLNSWRTATWQAKRYDVTDSPDMIRTPPTYLKLLGPTVTRLTALKLDRVVPLSAARVASIRCPGQRHHDIWVRVNRASLRGATLPEAMVSTRLLVWPLFQMAPTSLARRCWSVPPGGMLMAAWTWSAALGVWRRCRMYSKPLCLMLEMAPALAWSISNLRRPPPGVGPTEACGVLLLGRLRRSGLRGKYQAEAGGARPPGWGSM